MSQYPKKEESTLQLVCKSIDRIFQHCQDGVKDCIDRRWDLLRYWLSSHEESKATSKPFSIYYTKKTEDDYVRIWKRFICYCIRLLDQEDQHRAEFLDSQLEALQEIHAMLELNEEDEALLDSQVFNLSIQFIMHSDYASKKSALVHFTHVLGLDDKKIGYRMPNTYTLLLCRA